MKSHVTVQDSCSSSQGTPPLGLPFSGPPSCMSCHCIHPASARRKSSPHSCCEGGLWVGSRKCTYPLVFKFNHLATHYNKNTEKCSLAVCESTKNRDWIWWTARGLHFMHNATKAKNLALSIFENSCPIGSGLRFQQRLVKLSFDYQLSVETCYFLVSKAYHIAVWELKVVNTCRLS